MRRSGERALPRERASTACHGVAAEQADAVPAALPAVLSDEPLTRSELGAAPEPDEQAACAAVAARHPAAPGPGCRRPEPSGAALLGAVREAVAAEAVRLAAFLGGRPDVRLAQPPA